MTQSTLKQLKATFMKSLNNIGSRLYGDNLVTDKAVRTFRSYIERVEVFVSKATIPQTFEMSAKDLDFFKKLLAVPSKYKEEGKIINFLSEYLDSKRYRFSVDELGNMYITKGIADYYPCVVAHLDTVHPIVDEMVINTDQRNLFATDLNGNKIGIGGDDKCGVFIALRLLEEFDNIKVAFFVMEEIGCIGSSNCSSVFFENVGYVIQFDAPEDYMVTHICNGVHLFDTNGTFFQKIEPIIIEHFGSKTCLFSHPYTDVFMLKSKFKFSCINLSCGYYGFHTKYEYVDPNVVELAFNLGKNMIQTLSTRQYLD